jgi:hypothetical protein
VSPVRIGDWRDEGGPARGAALLAVPSQEHPAFFADTIDVRRLIAHVATVVNAGVLPANVVTHDYENVWLLRLRRKSGREQGYRQKDDQIRQKT